MCQLTRISHLSTKPSGVPTCKKQYLSLRDKPISLTPGLSKVLEDSVVRWMLDDLNGKIDLILGVRKFV